MKKSGKTVFICGECGYSTPKWMGKCPDCGLWHTFSEERLSREASGKKATTSHKPEKPTPIDQVEDINHKRLLTGIEEFDRVLGGGLVFGSIVLIGGDPGIGKSTLMLQALYGLSERYGRVLYVSGEESTTQIKLRSQRTGSMCPGLYVVSEVNFERIVSLVENEKPAVLVLDSIQTLFSEDITSTPGSVSQVREVTFKLSILAKKLGIPTLLVGHVTKGGAIAGPRLLEHMVDTVLYFEGDKNHIFRILRAVKNRFGSTNEIGVFEMKEKGLEEVKNPSAVFLAERPISASGSVVTSSMEGSRPILIELQALATPTSFSSPKRTVLGLDSNRVALLAAVLEKKLGMPLVSQDIFLNVAGGVRVDEPAVDLGVISAIASSYIDRPVKEGTILIGEVGLTGEIRGVGHIEARVNEAAKMGFDTAIIPRSNMRNLKIKENIRLTGVLSVGETLEILF